MYDGGEEGERVQRSIFGVTFYEFPLTETINTMLLYDPSEDHTGG